MTVQCSSGSASLCASIFMPAFGIMIFDKVTVNNVPSTAFDRSIVLQMTCTIQLQCSFSPKTFFLTVSMTSISLESFLKETKTALSLTVLG